MNNIIEIQSIFNEKVKSILIELLELKDTETEIFIGTYNFQEFSIFKKKMDKIVLISLGSLVFSRIKIEDIPSIFAWIQGYYEGKTKCNERT